MKVLNAVKVAFKNRNDVSSWLFLHDAFPLLSKNASEMYAHCSMCYQLPLRNWVFGFGHHQSENVQLSRCKQRIRLAVLKMDPNTKDLLKQNQV